MTTTTERTAWRTGAVEAPRPGAVRRRIPDLKTIRVEIFAGLVVALALIPETISFAVIAGVSPVTGLMTSFVFAMVIAVLGGRPALVSGAAGSIALVMAPLVRDHGMSYLVAAVALGGTLQVVFSLAGAAKLMRFVPESVMKGFVNGLAILIAAAQIPELVGVPWLVYPLVVAGLVGMYLLHRFAPAVPAPVVTTVALALVVAVLALDVPLVGSGRELQGGLPVFGLPEIPWTAETLWIILPFALAMALIGLLESFITAELVDEITETGSDLRREGWGQGATNLVVAFTGGMGGCAMIGQTMMNVKGCGGRTRLSTFTAGVVLLVLVVFATPILALIPMAALVAVMLVVAFTTVDWNSVAPRTLKAAPLRESAAMIVTIGVTLVTHNLAIAVICGVVVIIGMAVAVPTLAHRRAHEENGGCTEKGPGAFDRIKVDLSR